VFRAYDKKTGQIIWETTVPTGQVQSLPMTYMYKRQTIHRICLCKSIDANTSAVGCVLAAASEVTVNCRGSHKTAPTVHQFDFALSP
jgi:hypothetical protein